MPRASITRRLSTIVAADVAGYSRLIGFDEEHTIASLLAHRSEFIDPKIAEYHGRIANTAGDSLLIEFASVLQAVRCAVEIQQGMQDRNSAVAAERRLEFRIGINLGDVVAEGDDLLGDGVNIAARLEAVADPGGVCLSDEVIRHVRGKLNVEFADGGKEKLKNIEEPVRVWRWGPRRHEHNEANRGEERPKLPDKPSIVVLPFTNMSGDPEQEYFSDGITEDIITALSKFGWLFVIARNSSFVYKGTSVDIREVARTLGARYVLEGSVRKGGNRLRITGQLLDATTGNHLWAERYDRNLEDIFELQDEITETIVGAIEPELGSAERQRAQRKPPNSLDAWDRYQHGLNHLWAFTPSGNRLAADHFRQAIERDPLFAEAHTHLARALMFARLLGWSSNPEQDLVEAGEHIDIALRLDDRDALAHAIRGMQFAFNRQYEDAITETRQAIALNSNLALSHHAMALVCFWANRCNEALASLEKVIRLSPADPLMGMYLLNKAAVEAQLSEFKTALDTAKAACRQPQTPWQAWVVLARTANAMGEPNDLQRAGSRIRELMPDLTVTVYRDKMNAHVHPDVLAPYVETLRVLGIPE